MIVHKEETINRSFVLTSEEMLKIVSLFDNSDQYVFKTICVDKTIRDFSTLGDLLEYENAPNKEIESLGINVSYKTGEKKAFIFFSKASINNITIRLDGEEKDVLKLLDLLHEQLFAISSWYGLISRLKYSGAFIKIFITWIIILPLNSLIIHKYFSSGILSAPSWVIYLAAFLALGFVINFIWDRIRGLYFPMGVFAIKQGAKRYKAETLYAQG